MTDLGIAIAIHVIAVLWWIGGLAFVTAVFLPAVRSAQLGDPERAFHRIEHRFAPQARVAVALVGLSGGYLLWRLDAWSWLGQTAFWWLDAMIAFWVLFAVILFVAEPLDLLQRALLRSSRPGLNWRRLHGFHALMLVMALIIIGGAVAGSHGF